MNTDPTFALGSRVAYTADGRLKGTVVGHGTVHNASDPRSSDTATHNVVIVRLDEALRLHGNDTFHAPFVQGMLTAA